jgi:hypothetical protein
MNYACPIPECGFAAHDSLSLEGHMENIHGAPPDASDGRTK